VVHSPGLGLWIVRVKITKKVSVSFIPESAGIVRHDVSFSCQVLESLDVSEVALVQGCVAQKVGCHFGGGRRTFCLPCNSRSVVTKVVSALSCRWVAGFLKDMVLCDGGRELQHCTMRITLGGPHLCTPSAYFPPPSASFTPPTSCIYLAQLLLSCVVNYTLEYPMCVPHPLACN
jgi:hypothetical protein